MLTVIIDNYDSFTFNLYQFVGELGGNPVVYRNDAITLKQIQSMQPTHVIISPGPGDPRDEAYFGVCAQAILELGPRIPLLGVCLGHQGIGHVFGGKVVRAPQIMHGKTSMIKHSRSGIFARIKYPVQGMRYHSLIVERESLPECLQITAELDDGMIMGMKHKIFPIHGIQFHPESVGTPEGKKIIKNFLAISH